MARVISLVDKIVFPVVEGASAVALTLTIKAYFQKRTVDEPVIQIYDFDSATCRTVKIITSDFGDQYYTWVFTDADIPAGVISDYHSGDSPPEFHVKLSSGTSPGVPALIYVRTSNVELKTTFSSLFSAELSNYVVDITTGTRLSFTGQTPLADGVAVDDVYKVGDFLHTILTNIFANAFNTSLTLDYDDSTRADSQDFRTDKVGSVLAKYAALEGRKYWQKLGWIVQSKSSYEHTGITITEINFVFTKLHNPSHDKALLFLWGSLDHVQSPVLSPDCQVPALRPPCQN